MPGRTGELADADGRRVAREDGAGRRESVQLAKDRSLDIQVLENRFDDKLRTRDGLTEGGGRVNAPQRCLGIRRRQPPLLDPTRQMALVGIPSLAQLSIVR